MQERCPHCRRLLYFGPMDSRRMKERTKRSLVEHIRLCGARQELVDWLAAQVERGRGIVGQLAAALAARATRRAAGGEEARCS